MKQLNNQELDQLHLLSLGEALRMRKARYCADFGCGPKSLMKKLTPFERDSTKEAIRAGHDRDAFLKFSREHGEWMRLYMRMNNHGRNPDSVRAVQAYEAWKKMQ